MPDTYEVKFTCTYEGASYSDTYDIVVEPVINIFGGMVSTNQVLVYAPADSDVYHQAYGRSGVNYVGYTPKTCLDYSVSASGDTVTINGYNINNAITVLGTEDYRHNAEGALVLTTRGDIAELILPSYINNAKVMTIAADAFHSTDANIELAKNLCVRQRRF